MAKRSHQQIAVKINAPVDEGIACLVSALSEFPELYTLSSCEGAAFVTFRCGRTLEDSSVFLCWLSRRLITASGASVTAQWGGRNSMVLTLRCPPSAIQQVTRIIRNATINLGASSHGRTYTESDNFAESPARSLIQEQYGAPANLRGLMLRDLRT